MKVVKHSLLNVTAQIWEGRPKGVVFQVRVMALDSSDSDTGAVDSNQRLPFVDAFKEAKHLRGVAGQQCVYLYLYVFSLSHPPTCSHDNLQCEIQKNVMPDCFQPFH